jgi:hypothetical protein
VRSLPAVRSVSWAWTVPLGYSATCEYIDVEGRPWDRKDQRPTAACNFVDPDYFDTMGVTLLRGRRFAESDDEATRPVAIINETMARRLWPGQDAIGRRFSATGPEGSWLEVVGIAANGKYEFIFEPPTMHFYAPLAQHYRAARTLHVRTAGIAPERLGAEVLQCIRGLDADLPAYVFGVSPYDPITFSGLSAFLGVVVLAASWIPARRASRLDPIVALREQ